MKFRILAVVFLLLAVTLGVLARAQTSANGSIEGVVVRIGSNEPIAGINVEMRRVEGAAGSPLGPLVFGGGYYSAGAVVVPNAPNPGDIFYARTTSDGRFVFTNLKPGKYRLLAADPANVYYPAEYGQRHPRGAGYNFTAEEAQSLRIRFEMAPFASVSGRVIGFDGKAAPHVRVMAAEVAYQNGERVLNLIQALQTDDRGEYRLFWLPPGQYYIGALPEGVRRRNYSVAFGPPGQVESLNQIFAQPLIHYGSSASGELVEQVYETVYYPGETNLHSARALDLRPGANLAGIDISLVAGRRPALRIRGVVISEATGKPAAGATIRAVPLAAGPVAVAPSVTANDNGAFEISGLMRGEYALVVAEPAANSGRRIQMVTLGDSGIEGLRLVTNGGLSLPVRITLDGQDAVGYQVNLAAVARFLPGVRGSAFPLLGVQPGIYRIGVTPVTPPASAAPANNAHVKSIRFAGSEVADGRIHIEEYVSHELEIDLGSRSGVVEGRVSDGQRSSANVTVALVPAGSMRPDLFKTAMTDLNGTFRIQGVAPGSYNVFAWPYVPSGMWQYPEFLRSVESSGRALTVSESSVTTIDLALLPELNP